MPIVPFFIGLVVDQTVGAYIPNMAALTKQIVKHSIINVIHVYLACNHENGTAKDWGKAILTFTQLIMQEKISVDAVDGQCHSDSKYKCDLSLTSLHLNT